MIKFENLMTAGWEPSIRGMRNPKNSWAKSDSCMGAEAIEEGWAWIGPNDHKLMMNLRNAGTDHRKYLRQIIVWVDIVAPLYWWKEFDTYKVGTVANSCSTMHTIHEKEFTLEDFSCEKLEPFAHKVFATVIDTLNYYRDSYNRAKNGDPSSPYNRDDAKACWDNMIQLLPTSYNQRRTVMFSYENLANMFHSREFHKLDEWREMCAWMKTLPYSELITGKMETEDTNESI